MPVKGVGIAIAYRLDYQPHFNYKYCGVNSPQAQQDGQAVTRAGSSPQVDLFIMYVEFKN